MIICIFHKADLKIFHHYVVQTNIWSFTDSQLLSHNYIFLCIKNLTYLIQHLHHNISFPYFFGIEFVPEVQGRTKHHSTQNPEEWLRVFSHIESIIVLNCNYFTWHYCDIILLDRLYVPMASVDHGK